MSGKEGKKRRGKERKAQSKGGKRGKGNVLYKP